MNINDLLPKNPRLDYLNFKEGERIFLNHYGDRADSGIFIRIDKEGSLWWKNDNRISESFHSREYQLYGEDYHYSYSDKYIPPLIRENN